MKKIQKDPRNDADVQMLLKVFSDITADGRVITHEQIEGVLRVSRANARYRTVVNKWRRLLQYERCVYLDGMGGHGRGFVSLTPDEMVRFSNRGVRAAGRKLRRMIAVVSMPDDAVLSESTRQYRAVLLLATEKLALEHRSLLRDVSRALAPMKQLPRPEIDQKDKKAS